MGPLYNLAKKSNAIIKIDKLMMDANRVEIIEIKTDNRHSA